MGHPKNYTLWKWKEFSQFYEHSVICRLIYSSNSLALWQPTLSIIRSCLRQVLERANFLHKLNTYFQPHGSNFQRRWVILGILAFQGSKSDICRGSDFLIFSVYGRSNFIKMSECLFSSPVTQEFNQIGQFGC